ncbi:MAG: thioredoxin fold domain-containing protein [Dorea sp.]|jgi:thioredoxin 1|nr:thioredoxin fold domain-containing protein [Dorea sp.]
MFHLTANNFAVEIKTSPLPVVVMFYAAWCGKCAMMKPLIEDIEPAYKNHICFFEVEVDESPELASQYGASIVPTFAFFQKEKLLGELQGVMEDTTFEKHLQRIFRNC